MDGILIDSEPLWQRAEIDLFGEIGVELTREMCIQTMGLRIDEVVAHWHARFGWESPSQEIMVARIVDRMVELISSEGSLLPGALQALEAVDRSGVRTALATSSFRKVMDAVLDSHDLRDHFEVAYSGQDEPYAKPHPAIYLNVADHMEVRPQRCVAIEDSVNGVIAAKAARMTCVAIPDHAAGDPAFGAADLVLGSLWELAAEWPDIAAVEMPRTRNTSSRRAR